MVRSMKSRSVLPIPDTHPLNRHVGDTCGYLASSHAELGLSVPGNAEPQLGAQPTPSQTPTH